MVQFMIANSHLIRLGSMLDVLWISLMMAKNMHKL